MGDEGHGMTAILSIQVTSYLRNSRSVWLSCHSCQQAVKRHQHDWNRGCVASSQLLATVVMLNDVALAATVEQWCLLSLLQRVTPSAAHFLCWAMGWILLLSKSWGFFLLVTEKFVFIQSFRYLTSHPSQPHISSLKVD